MDSPRAPDGQEFALPAPAEGARIGHFRVQWQEGPRLVLRRGRKAPIIFGLVGLLLLLWGATAAFALAVQPAIVLGGGGVICLIVALGRDRMTFDESGVRLTALFGLLARHVPAAELQDVTIVLDDLPVQGCTVVLGLTSGKRLRLDAREVHSSPNAPNFVLLAFWLGERLGLPLKIEGELRAGGTALANVLLEFAVEEDEDAGERLG